GAHQSTNGGNRAERAALVAAFGNSQIGVVARGETEAGAVVFEDGEAGGFGFLGKTHGINSVGVGELFGEVVIFAQEVPMILSGVLLTAHRFDDVLAIEDSDQA